MPRLRSRDLLVALRRQKGLTQAQLGESAGCSRATIGHLETGEMEFVSQAIADGICQGLGVAVNTLFVMPGDASGVPVPRM